MPRNYPHNDLLHAAKAADLKAYRAKLERTDYALALILGALAGLLISLSI